MLTELADEILYIVAELFSKSVVETHLKIGDWPTLHPFSRKKINQIQQIIDQLVLQLFYVRFLSH